MVEEAGICSRHEIDGPDVMYLRNINAWELSSAPPSTARSQNITESVIDRSMDCLVHSFIHSFMSFRYRS